MDGPRDFDHLDEVEGGRNALVVESNVEELPAERSCFVVWYPCTWTPKPFSWMLSLHLATLCLQQLLS